jgi:UDP-N-acetylmuramate dehydrogenase
MAVPPTEHWLEAWPGVRRHEPLGRHSQYGIGGPADWFLQTASVDELARVCRGCAEHDLPVTVIGAGSNTLIQDGGVRGLVVEFTDKHLTEVGGDTVELGGGAMMPRAALDCARRGLAGLEFGIGIPGTCGASVRGNAGAFGSEIADALIGCTAVTASGEMVELSTAECGFAYRTSVFKRDHPRWIVVSARFRVSADDPADVRRRTDAIQAQRKASQPYGIRSLGSVFQNPPGDHAGRLIESCGLKGRRHGGAEISEKHANFIVNVDHASAADVLALVALAHDTVMERCGVDLLPEIVVMGEPLVAETGRARV